MYYINIIMNNFPYDFNKNPQWTWMLLVNAGAIFIILMGLNGIIIYKNFNKLQFLKNHLMRYKDKNNHSNLLIEKINIIEKNPGYALEIFTNKNYTNLLEKIWPNIHGINENYHINHSINNNKSYFKVDNIVDKNHIQLIIKVIEEAFN